MSNLKDKIVLSSVSIVALALAAFLIGAAFSMTRPVASPAPADPLPVISATGSASSSSAFEWSLPGTMFTLRAAVTPAEQEQGLGDMPSLASTSGMFFIFSAPDDYGFWMKGMEFPLDIIWLDQNLKIVRIESDLAPSTYPAIVYPGAPAEYVIEVNAGTAREYSLEVGQTMRIRQK